MSKVRSDAWGEDLPEETRLELYALTKSPVLRGRDAPAPHLGPSPSPSNPSPSPVYLRDFDRDVLPYLSLQGIVAPSRAGWYRFLGRMREREAAKTIISVETSKRIAEGMTAAKIDPRLAADMMTSLSVDEAAKPDGERNEKVMQIFASAAAMFKSAEQRDRELALKAAAQQTKDEQLKLAREKFEAAEKRLERVAEIADAARGGKVDPAKVADEIDRILGRKKQFEKVKVEGEGEQRKVKVEGEGEQRNDE